MYPLIVSKSSVHHLLSVLGSVTSPFHEMPIGQDTIEPQRDGQPFLAGQRNDWAFLLDYRHTLLGSCWSSLARVAQELKTLVISVAFDQIESQCEFFAADGETIVRAVWSNRRRTTRPFSLGNPLSSERSFPLSSEAGLIVALQGFGAQVMDSDRGFENSPSDRWMTWQGDSLKLMEVDGLRGAVNEHVRAFANPAYQGIKAVVKVRRVSE